MSKFLGNVRDLNAFKQAIKECTGEVWLRKNDGSEEFNLKSTLSEYIALGKLCDEHGSDYEIFCQLASDESRLLKFYYERETR